MAKVDSRTKRLVKRIQPGDVMVIDHEDLDRVAAETIIEARAGAVINVAASISGRYPNLGPLLVCAAGIPLVDGVGPEVLEAVEEGQLVTVDGPDVLVDGKVVGQRHPPDACSSSRSRSRRPGGRWASSSSASPRTRSRT